MAKKKTEIGRAGEAVARKYLEQRGYSSVPIVSIRLAK